MNNRPRVFDKIVWQREQRRKFRDKYGYSDAAMYSTGGLRQAVLERDGYACVKCGMTDAEHKRIWNRPITTDHKDKDRSHNTMDNLQTLCLRCHGKKDLIPALRTPLVPAHKETILALRRAGKTYRAIAKAVGFSVGIIYRWERIWNERRSI